MLEVVKKRSPDAETKVACILVEDKKIVGVGFNGWPAGIDGLPDHRPEKYPFFVHSEPNAIVNCKKDVKNPIAYITHLPCNVCLKMMWNFGVRKIIVPPNRKVFSYTDDDYLILGTLIINGLKLNIGKHYIDNSQFDKNIGCSEYEKNILITSRMKWLENYAKG